MPIESATYISQLVATNPPGTDPFAEGDDQLRLIKSVLQSQFPNFEAAAATPTVAQVNTLTGISTSQTIEERLSALEAKTQIALLPSQAYDFNNSWWTTPANVDQTRIYSASVASSALSNVPWPWGSNDPGGRTYQLVVQKFINDGVACALNTVFRRSSNDAYSELFFRQAPSAAGLTSAPWMRSTFAEIDTAQATSGTIEYSSVCPEKAARCP